VRIVPPAPVDPQDRQPSRGVIVGRGFQRHSTGPIKSLVRESLGLLQDVQPHVYKPQLPAAGADRSLVRHGVSTRRGDDFRLTCGIDAHEHAVHPQRDQNHAQHHRQRGQDREQAATHDRECNVSAVEGVRRLRAGRRTDYFGRRPGATIAESGTQRAALRVESDVHAHVVVNVPAAAPNPASQPL
jgi:hypothetical protein